MTRRERMEARLDRRQEWAGKAKARAEQRFAAAGQISDGIPLGQPIMVGHHSERHARRDADRIRGNMTKGVEETRLAARHASKASGLAIALDRSVFSDDPDAPERLAERIAENERAVERMTSTNRAWRKAKGTPTERAAELSAAGLLSPKAAEMLVQDLAECPWVHAPFAPYQLTNLRARIRRDRARLEELTAAPT